MMGLAGSERVIQILISGGKMAPVLVQNSQHAVDFRANARVHGCHRVTVHKCWHNYNPQGMKL